MKLEYRQSRPPGARTWFARFPPRQHQQLLDQLIRWQSEICEASVQGTEQDRSLWSIACAADRDIWHRAQQHRNQPNTMLSVLAGAIDKLRRGGDLTEKQLGHVRDICTIMHHHGRPQVTITAATEVSGSGRGLQDLRDRLFYYG